MLRKPLPKPTPKPLPHGKPSLRQHKIQQTPTYRIEKRLPRTPHQALSKTLSTASYAVDPRGRGVPLLSASTQKLNRNHLPLSAFALSTGSESETRNLESTTVVPANLSKYLMNRLSFNRVPTSRSKGNKMKILPMFLTPALS